MLNPGVRKAFDWIAGLALIAFGVACFVIPFLPGWPFLIAGLAVLSSHSRWAHSLHVRAQDIARRVRRRMIDAKSKARGQGGGPG